ncbi:DNA-3-methyladenine glycosylase 2 [Arthrobacter sp. Bz4]|uniref:DNA-3-methyladenine glycosylase family protein n=1 Tax=Arthrobacter sp. Bz4 TaxID=2171979 RepID=UPI001A9C5377|nr:DNA-3-methyladenine glycosylase 2 [Arthrobacter sp. Bz4]
MNSVFLAANGSIETVPMVALLANHFIPGCEVPDRSGSSHTRLLSTASGHHAVTLTVGSSGVEVSTSAPLSQVPGLTATIRRWLDLDTDLTAVAAAFDDDALLGPLVRHRPGLRAVGYPEPFEAAIMTVLGQQVSVAAAGTFGGRLAAAYGTPGAAGLTVFPTPEALASAPPEQLRSAVGVTRTRGATVQHVARAFCDGLILHGDPTDIRQELLAIPGIGPWSADYLMVRVLGDRDAFTPGDLVLRRAMGNPSIREADIQSERWRPYRAYALFHLWTEATSAEKVPHPQVSR